ncbi:hypothetical protein [Streptomyces sp. H27-C3]|uniref:hypothetical protein n=1 Tax=Streptomyces sp. H27-C3 TaxID=3046305 RepID=UPI0024BA83C0|nr:hypothetical protein [Streptomyces sp. H27-C3]MDJ0463107.1 hypothetical protein [Streptomyces sp. H27-C3]
MTNFFCRLVGVNRGQKFLFTTWTQEMSAPYRRCDRTFVMRVGGLKAVALGRYHRVLADEDAAMMHVFRTSGSPMVRGDADA